ncbi:hypothetical protein [Sphingopyxis sp.]
MPSISIERTIVTGNKVRKVGPPDPYISVTACQDAGGAGRPDLIE